MRPSGSVHMPRWIGLPRSIALQDLEPEAEADLVVRGLKLRGVANAGNDHAANGDRVIDGVREHRILAGRRENARAQHGARGVLRARKREEVGEIGRGLANRPRTVNVIGHRLSPSLGATAKRLIETVGGWREENPPPSRERL